MYSYFPMLWYERCRNSSWHRFFHLHPKTYSIFSLDNVQEFIMDKKVWKWIEWMATLPQNQERLIKIPCAAFLKPLSVHSWWHCLSLHGHIQLFSQVTSALCASDEQWSLTEGLFHVFCIAQHAQHIYCITPRQRASLRCSFWSVLLCIRFLILSIPGPTF